MSKFNGIRIINLNYNHNTIKIDDEYFELNGLGTLFTLQNGGGKSVLVQMIVAPFVHKRYRNTNDRPFESYFTTNRPTLILIEWKLEGSAGYVLTGMMVRKNQEMLDEKEDALEITNFIYEYDKPNQYDIRQFPVIIQSKENKQLLSYLASKKLLEELKSKKNGYFNYYDLNNSTQQKNYFEHLAQYQIYFKEWESIIKKINLKESGLSELFKEAKDEKGLIEKWFLGAVEDKLNKEENRIGQFEAVVGKYIKQYKENLSNIERKNNILKFLEETTPIHDIAVAYQHTIDEKIHLENQIASLITTLKIWNQSTEQKKRKLQEELLDINQEILEIQYEEASLWVYKKEDQAILLKTKIEQNKEKILEIETTIKDLQYKRHTLQCARYFSIYVRDSQEVQNYENRLMVVREQKKDLMPERDNLGYNLRVLYETKEKKLLSEKKALEKQLDLCTEKIKQQQDMVYDLQKKQEEDNQTLGTLNAQIKSYDQIESTFNERYQEESMRNILGNYETGYLEQLISTCENQLQKTEQTRILYKKQREENEQKLYQETRTIEDCQKQLGSLQQEIRMLETNKKDFENQLEDRKIALRYIALSEDDLFATDKIQIEFEKKCMEIEKAKKKIELEWNQLSKEYKKLETGQVLTLPSQLEEAFQSKGITYIYGMDWLRKNGLKVEENQKLVKGNPFIPYSIIMEKKELERLRKAQTEVFTNFPITIVLRETLSLATDSQESSLVIGTKANFYLLFNYDLLDEKQLKLILGEKKLKMQELNTNINRREEELQFHQNKYNMIQYQTVTKENMESCIKALDKLNGELTLCSSNIHNGRSNADKIREAQKKREEQIRKLEKEFQKLTEKKKDALLLNKSYEEYLSTRDERSWLKKHLEEQTSFIYQTQSAIQEYRKEKEEQIRTRDQMVERFKEIQGKISLFASYQQGQLLKKDPEDMEARYDAITNQIADDQKQLEQSLARAQERFKDSQDELIDYSDRYQIPEADYRQVTYDRFYENQMEDENKQLEKNLKQLMKSEQEQEKEQAVLLHEIETEKKRIQKTFDKEHLKPKEEIIIRDFQKEQITLKITKSKKEETFQATIYQKNIFEDNLSHLAEYELFPCKETVVFQEPLEHYSKEQWYQFRGKLIRDYNQIKSDELEKRQVLSENLMERINQDIFQDDFYQNPLNRLYELRTSPAPFIEQLNLISISYQSMLEKLEIDLAFLEKEKEKVVELLTDYVQSIHDNLNKIDRNSTISIRNRSVKMLRMKLPNWADQEELFIHRIYDLVEELLKQGILLLGKNEQIDEMLGKQITTRNLYDRVVGTGNIEIRLFKIEEQKEYPISWNDVAKNSGGEGFLSAFVILSSLLSFMRREDTDIFASKEEGKVLIMDNPFAQTNASHLLKPLMEIAQKTNTQLICLTGLGGDSIYNRFDNIYVLTPVNSNFQPGTQYLKSEHAKGEDVMQQIVSSRVLVEDMEQTELNLF